MSAEVPESTINLECPVRKKVVEVTFEIQPFRMAEHEGIHVTACSEFLKKNGIPSCGKDCIHTEEAEKIHLEEVYKRYCTHPHITS